MPAPSAGAERPADASKRAAAELSEQIEVLRAEVAKLSEQIASSGDVSLHAMRKAAAAGVEQLKSQGEQAMDSLRSNARDLEGMVCASVREKPVTSLAIAAAAGYILALLSRR